MKRTRYFALMIMLLLCSTFIIPPVTAADGVSNPQIISSLNKSIQKTQQFNGLSTLRKTPLPVKIGAVFLYIFWTP